MTDVRGTYYVLRIQYRPLFLKDWGSYIYLQHELCAAIDIRCRHVIMEGVVGYIFYTCELRGTIPPSISIFGAGMSSTTNVSYLRVLSAVSISVSVGVPQGQPLGPIEIFPTSQYCARENSLITLRHLSVNTPEHRLIFSTRTSISNLIWLG